MDQELLKPTSFSEIKNIIEVVASVLTLFAIIFGGIWSYLLFIRTRQKYPSANISQEITYRAISDDKLWLRVSVTLQNTGKVLLSLVYGQSWIQKVLPLDKATLEKVLSGQYPARKGEVEIEWPLLSTQHVDWKKGDREIEPSESDQVHFDFILDSEVKTIVVYSYFRNAKKIRRKGELGWLVTRTYDLQLKNSREMDQENEDGKTRKA